MVNSHQRWKQTQNRVCFHLWCELTLVNRPIIFGKMHFLLISEIEFFHEIKCNGITSFMEFMTMDLCPIKWECPPLVRTRLGKPGRPTSPFHLWLFFSTNGTEHKTVSKVCANDLLWLDYINYFSWIHRISWHTVMNGSIYCELLEQSF